MIPIPFRFLALSVGGMYLSLLWVLAAQGHPEVSNFVAHGEVANFTVALPPVPGLTCP